MAAVTTPLSSRASANLRFFGTGEGGGGGAPWFQPEKLSDPNFSVEAFVADLRQYAPLETLSGELEAYLATLKSKLVEVINQDYNDFVSLSTKLVNVDGAVLRMQRPLQEAAERVAGVRGSLQAELDALGEGLRLRQEAAAARGLLELMQDMAHTMSKVESLLVEIEAAEEEEVGMGGEALDSRCRMLERLASEVSRLAYHATKGKDLPFVQQLEAPMRAAREKLQFRLAAALKAALVDKHASARHHCLLSFAAISDLAGAEQVVRDTLVRPMVAEIFDRVCTPGPRAADSFSQVLDEVTARVAPDLGPLLEVTSGPESSLQSFNFLGNSLLAEVDYAVGEQIPGAASPGVPATFLGNYKRCLAFLEALEGQCATRAGLAAFRGCPAYASFLRRWRLSIYFSTRFQEIAAAFESAIASETPIMGDPKPEAGMQLQLTPSQALVACLQRSISEEVFLRPLADKFCRLLLQLLARYTSWLAQGAGHRQEESATAATEGAGESRRWGHATPLELLASARADLDNLGPWLRRFQEHSLAPLLAFLPPQVGEAVAGALEAAVASLEREVAPVTGVVVSELADRCASGLSQLRGITAMYRMSARPAPTRASHYVAGILAMLKQFLDLPNAAALQEPARTEIAEGVVSEVAQRFRKMSSELLETLRKTESSLKRIRQNRATDPAAGAGGPSDIDKISLQLFLDVQEFGRQSKRYGVSPESLAPFQQLWKAVAPSDKADTVDLS